MVSPPAGTCNNGESSPANIVAFWNLSSIIATSAAGSPVADTSFRYFFQHSQQNAQLLMAPIPFQQVPKPPNANRDYWYKVAVYFQRLGRDPKAAAATLTTSGQVEQTTRTLQGPASLLAGTNGQWRIVTSPGYDSRLYLKRWTLDGSIVAPSAGDSTVQVTANTAGTHTLKTFVTLADAMTDSVQASFQVQLNASISGPTALSSPGNCSWTVGSTGAGGVSPTYAWQLQDPSTGSWTSLATGQVVTINAGSGWPPPKFNLWLTVSAGGYTGNTSMLEVANGMATGCGGFLCAYIRPNAPKSLPVHTRVVRQAASC